MPTRSTALFSVSKRSGASPDNFRSFFFKPNFRSSAFRSCFYKRISITNIWPYRFVCLPRLQLVDCLHCSNQAWRGKYCIGLCIVPFSETRSYAALRAADLDWIIGPGYSLGGYILEKNQEKPTWNHEKPLKTMKNYEKP